MSMGFCCSHLSNRLITFNHIRSTTNMICGIGNAGFAAASIFSVSKATSYSEPSRIMRDHL